jgi:hypothetical protein
MFSDKFEIHPALDALVQPACWHLLPRLPPDEDRDRARSNPPVGEMHANGDLERPGSLDRLDRDVDARADRNGPRDGDTTAPAFCRSAAAAPGFAGLARLCLLDHPLGTEVRIPTHLA